MNPKRDYGVFVQSVEPNSPAGRVSVLLQNRYTLVTELLKVTPFLLIYLRLV